MTPGRGWTDRCCGGTWSGSRPRATPEPASPARSRSCDPSAAIWCGRGSWTPIPSPPSPRPRRRSGCPPSWTSPRWRPCWQRPIRTIPWASGIGPSWRCSTPRGCGSANWWPWTWAALIGRSGRSASGAREARSGSPSWERRRCAPWSSTCRTAGAGWPGGGRPRPFSSTASGTDSQPEGCSWP